MGAAATYEGLIADKQLDEAIALLPILAKESPVRYLPRLNDITQGQRYHGR